MLVWCYHSDASGNTPDIDIARLLLDSPNLKHLATTMPHLKFILPTAPTQPVTMNAGIPMPSWYDITGLDERSNENCAGIDRSAARVKQILEHEHAANGLPYRRMVLAGFSQGGALSLFTGLQLPRELKLGGIVVMSGYLPAARVFDITPGLGDTPIMHCHGEADVRLCFFVLSESRSCVVFTNHVLCALDSQWWL